MLLLATNLSLNTVSPSLRSRPIPSEANRIAELQAEIAELQAELDILLESEDQLSTESNTNQPDTQEKELDNSINLVPFGQKQEITETINTSDSSYQAVYDLTVIDSVRGEEAEEILQGISSVAYADIPEDHEWIVIELDFNYLEGDENDPYRTFSYLYSLITRDGQEIEQETFAFITDDSFDSMALFPGNSHQGLIAVHAPVGEEVLLAINYHAFDQDAVYFEIEE